MPGPAKNVFYWRIHKPPPLSGVIAPPSGAYLTQTVHLSDVSLRFEIWDTAGQEKYHSVTPLYYRGAHVALIVYDISNRVGEEQQVQQSFTMLLGVLAGF